MASLRTRALRDGTLTYSVLFRLDGKQTSETFDTPQAARTFIRDIDKHGPDAARRILDTRRHPDDERRTLTDQLHAYIDTLSGATPGTRNRYRMYARQIAEHRIGSMPLEALNRKDVALWIGDLTARYAANTVKSRTSFLSAALGHALKDGLIDRNPAEKAKTPRGERREHAHLTTDEFTTLMRHIPERDRSLIYTLAGTGLRIAEATALQVRDLRLTDTPPTLTVSRGWVSTYGDTPKTGAPKTEKGRRTIALPEQVTPVLRAQTTGRPATSWVFSEDGDGLEPVDRRRLQERWTKAVRASGITKRPRIHDLRHTHVSWLIAEGVPLTIIQHRVGHASISVTSDVYGHLVPEAQVQAARAASLALGAGLLPQIDTIRQT